MTDQATAIGLVPFSGRPFPSAIQGRSEPAIVPASREPQEPGRAAEIKPADPATTPRTPPLAGETQIAAQQDRVQGAAKPGGSTPAGSSTTGARQPGELTEEQKKKVQVLQERDRAVRAHEAAHKLAGGSYAGQPTFETVKGPDGQAYAVSGEVSIDTSEVPNNPDATISKLETVIRAALAPSDPSAQDRQVAAEAQAKIQKARQEKEQKATKEAEKTQESGVKADPGVTASSGTNDASPSGAGKSNPVARATARRDTAFAPGTLFNLVA